VSLGSGLLRDLVTCCNRYLASIEGMADPELLPHRERAAERLRSIATGIDRAMAQAPSDEPELASIANWGHQLRVFRHTQLPFFAHYREDERYLTLLAAQVSEEAGCPIPTPIVGTFSNRGYWTVPELRSLCVPAREGDQLLTLPDLVHELGHVLIAELGGELVRDLLQSAVAPYTASLEDQTFGRRLHAQYTTWHVEFVADAFAAYVCGPSYGWQHIRLGAQAGTLASGRPWSPAGPSTGLPLSSHPADAARMAVILATLGAVGEPRGVERLETEWESLTAGAGEPPPSYATTYADGLLSAVVERTVDWCRSNAIVAFAASDHDAVVRHVARAWELQLSDPNAFAAEEDTRVAELRALVESSAGDE
jgi:hypothetical protein